MELLANYPFSESVISPHIGRQVGLMMADGSVEYGIIDRVYEDNLILRPVGPLAEAGIAQYGKASDHQKWNMKIKNYCKKKGMKYPANLKKAKIKGLGWGAGYPLRLELWQLWVGSRMVVYPSIIFLDCLVCFTVFLYLRKRYSSATLAEEFFFEISDFRSIRGSPLITEYRRSFARDIMKICIITFI